MLFEWNEPVWESLIRAAERLPHALLIHGPRGIGKRALAEHFAGFLLCESGGPERPCGQCQACRWFLAGNHPDVRWLEPEAIARASATEVEEAGQTGSRTSKPSLEIKVDQVRGLTDFLNVGSHRGGRRIALVHPAEDMNRHAANSLLKSLEEPPAGAVFVLVSHRAARLLPTIRSRCVALPVGLPDRTVAESWLRSNGVAQDAARWLSFAGGAPLRALEYALGPRGGSISRLLEALREGVCEDAVGDREDLDALAETLQKFAFDRAFAAFGVEPKYGAGSVGSGGARGSDWLAFARVMGRNRALARHPLNPRLFAAEMLAAMPASGRR